jgi:hypothetical protein
MKAIFILLISTSTFAIGLQNEVIYGIDNRKPLESYSEIDFKWKSVSIAMMIQKNILEESFGGILTKVQGATLEKQYSVCSNEPNAKDLIFGKCTGFLVGPDLLATAGHCATSSYSCKEDFKWIFEFRDDLILESGIEDEVYISSKNVYGCSEIVHREYDYSSKLDFALIRLDRPVLDRPILAIRNKGQIENDAELVLIGHPIGLPQKVTSDGLILENTNPIFFKTNLDSFVGNSGSPVFNKKTGLVEGILVRGEDDFITDEENDCERLHFCPENGQGCDGEDVTRITQIPELMGIPTPPQEGPVTEDSDNYNWNCFFSTLGC